MSMQWGSDAYVRHKQENERQVRREEKVPLLVTRLVVGMVVAYVIILFGGPALRAKLAAKSTPVDASFAAVKR